MAENTLPLDLLLPIKLSSEAKEEVFEIPDSEAACGFKATLVEKNNLRLLQMELYYLESKDAIMCHISES